MKRKLPRCIGVIHLPPLPGSPGAARLDPASALSRAGLWAVKEAKALQAAGFDGIIIENFGDAPFYKSSVPPETIASFSVIAAAVRESVRLPIGINVLRNDARAALSIASVTGAEFIRVNVLSGVTATDQGLIEGDAAGLIRERIRMNSEHIAILADVHVKHGRSLSSESIALAIEETAGRGGADGVIITGTTTGRAPILGDLEMAQQAAHHAGVPLYMGSGMDPKSLESLFGRGSKLEAGLIVGSTLRKGGKAGAPMDSRRVKAFISAVKGFRNGKARRASS
jgi:membrane complex biogenesis BtpA family protein